MERLIRRKNGIGNDLKFALLFGSIFVSKYFVANEQDIFGTTNLHLKWNCSQPFKYLTFLKCMKEDSRQNSHIKRIRLARKVGFQVTTQCRQHVRPYHGGKLN